MAELRVGISGFRYASWRKVFYPAGLAQKEELAYAAEHFNSIELNGSFYSLQTPKLYAQWYAATPPGFLFAVKGGRFITHLKRLRDVATPLANFFASGVLELGDKLGPILWQFPERLPFDERFEAFFELLPKDTREAAALARRHDERVKGPSFGEPRRAAPLRHAIEVRSPTFRSPQFIRVLRKHRIAIVVSDTAGRWPYFEDVTADFVYIRLHGDQELYASGYSPTAIRHWAARVRCWQQGGEPSDATRAGPPTRARKERDMYVYFDNDAKVHAPYDALSLARALGVRWPVR